MYSLWCLAYKCTQTTAEYEDIEDAVAEARENRWLVRTNSLTDNEEFKYVVWCRKHRVNVPQWHETVRTGEISEYL